MTIGKNFPQSHSEGPNVAFSGPQTLKQEQKVVKNAKMRSFEETNVASGSSDATYKASADKLHS